MLQRQQTYALSRRSDSLRSENLLQTFKMLNEMDGGGEPAHDNASDRNLRASFPARDAPWRGVHDGERATFEQHASLHHHQRPESCNNCYTRVQVINLRPITGAAASGAHLTAGRVKDFDDTASGHSFRKPISALEPGASKLNTDNCPNLMSRARPLATEQRPDSELGYPTAHPPHAKGYTTPRSQHAPYIKNQLNLNNQRQPRAEVSEVCTAPNAHQANSTGHHKNAVLLQP